MLRVTMSLDQGGGFVNDNCGHDLSDIVAETIVINPPHFVQRRQASKVLCDRIGISRLQFSEGVLGLPHQLACTRAHRIAMKSIKDYPSLVLEDDLTLTGERAALPVLPEDADIVYLSVTPFGCLPWTRENLGIARHRALQGLSLASRHNDEWLKVHSMSGGQAILYVTDKGRKALVTATEQAERFGGPFDVFTTYAMNDVNVYAPRTPVFSEDGDLQRSALRDNVSVFARRMSFTRTPLHPFTAGQQTVVHC